MQIFNQNSISKHKHTMEYKQNANTYSNQQNNFNYLSE